MRKTKLISNLRISMKKEVSNINLDEIDIVNQ